MSKRKSESGSGLFSVEVDRGALVRAVMAVKGIAPARGLPITSHLLLRAGEGGLEVQATDLSVYAQFRIPAEVHTPGAITLDAQRLLGFVRELPAGSVKIEGLENAHARISAGRSVAKLSGLPSSDWPQFIDEEPLVTLALPGAALGEMIDRVIFSTAIDEIRPTLSGVLWETDDTRLSLVGTDGHRLAVYRADTPATAQRAIVPRDGMRLLRRMLDDEDIGISFGRSLVTFRADAWSLSARLIDGEFPTYSAVIPQSSTVTVEVDRSEIAAAVRRVSVVTSDRAKGIALTVGEWGITLSASSADYGEASERVECDAPAGAEHGTVAFNAAYLLQALESLEGCDRVRLALGGDAAPALMTVAQGPQKTMDGWMHVLMPMRL